MPCLFQKMNISGTINNINTLLYQKITFRPFGTLNLFFNGLSTHILSLTGQFRRNEIWVEQKYTPFPKSSVGTQSYNLYRTPVFLKASHIESELHKIVPPFTKGEIRERVKPLRYLAIIQGFIGWFMLTIFSVSLISQLLN